MRFCCQVWQTEVVVMNDSPNELKEKFAEKLPCGFFKILKLTKHTCFFSTVVKTQHEACCFERSET